MGLHLEPKWTISDPEDLRVPEIIRSLWKICMASLGKLNLLRISKIIPYLLELLSWNNLEPIYSSSSRRKYKKMTIGKVYPLFLPVQVRLAKENIKLWSLFVPIRIISNLKIIIVCMVLMPISSCWAWLCL